MVSHKVTGIRLSVLIVNYNGRSVISDCLQSLQGIIGQLDEVVVVDNASTDGSDEIIENDFPWVKLIRSEINLGFSGGNNLAAKYARGKYLLLLNNDATIESGLEVAMSHFDDPHLGVLGANIHYPDGSLQPSVGHEHTPIRIVFSWIGLRRISGFFSRTVDDAGFYVCDQSNVDWVSGAAFITRRDLWCSLGGLDENYFMYLEDVDYCRMINAAGCRVDYCHDFKVIHHEACGRPWVGERALLNTANSYNYFLHKFYPKRIAQLTRLMMSNLFLFRSFYYFLKRRIRNNPVVSEKYYAYSHAASLLLKFDYRDKDNADQKQF